MSKINSVSSNEIGGHIGDMISVENSLAFKKLFKLFGSDNLEFREKKFYLEIHQIKLIIYLILQLMASIHQILFF